MTDYGDWFDDSMNDRPVALSDAARARRDSMRRDLERRVVSRRRGRAVLRGGVASLLVAACAWLVLTERRDVTQDAGYSRPEPVVSDRPFEMQHADFALVATNDDVMERYCAPRRELPAEVFLDDDQLIQDLRAIDRPASLLRTGDRVLVYPDVVDPLTE